MALEFKVMILEMYDVIAEFIEGKRIIIYYYNTSYFVHIFKADEYRLSAVGETTKHSFRSKVSSLFPFQQY